MARCLIIGCGCRGRALASELIARGHAVRGTTRLADRCAAIEQVGAEAVLADPDRVGTLAAALDHVGVVFVALGSAAGAPERVSELHSTRLDMLLSRILDTTVRGVVYETSGTVDPSVLRAGAARVRTVCEDSHIPYALVEAVEEPTAWVAAAIAAVERVLEGRCDSSREQ